MAVRGHGADDKTELTTYYCVGPEEFVRFEDRFLASSVLSHLSPSPDSPTTTTDTTTDTTHTLTLSIRISPNPPHEYEFPILKRVNGCRYLNSGRFCSWRTLWELNKGSVKPPPPTSSTTTTVDHSEEEEDASMANGNGNGNERWENGPGMQIKLAPKPVDLEDPPTTAINGPDSKKPKSAKKRGKKRNSSTVVPAPPSASAEPPSLLSRISDAPSPLPIPTNGNRNVPPPHHVVTPTSSPSKASFNGSPRGIQIKGLAAAKAASSTPATPVSASAPVQQVEKPEHEVLFAELAKGNVGLSGSRWAPKPAAPVSAPVPLPAQVKPTPAPVTPVRVSSPLREALPRKEEGRWTVKPDEIVVSLPARKPSPAPQVSPATKASSPTPTPKQSPPAVGKPNGRILPTTLPLKPPASLSLTPTPVGSRGPTRPPSPTMTSLALPQPAPTPQPPQQTSQRN